MTTTPAIAHSTFHSTTATTTTVAATSSLPCYWWQPTNLLLLVAAHNLVMRHGSRPGAQRRWWLRGRGDSADLPFHPTAYLATVATTRSHITTTTAPSQHNSVLRAVSPIPRTNKQMRSHGTGARRPQLPEPGHTNTAVAVCVSRFCDQL